LQTEFAARPHLSQTEAFLIDNPSLPFYRPRLIDKHLSVLSFNYLPLSPQLIQALISHPELAPLTALVCWTAEQDLIVKGTLESLKRDWGK